MKVNLQQAAGLTGEQQFAAYACLDTTGTREIFDVLQPRLNANQRRIYDWSLAQQSPAVAMTLRGVRVDTVARQQALTDLTLEAKAKLKEIRADALVREYWDGAEIRKGECTAGKKRHAWPPGISKYTVADLRAMDEVPACKRCGVSRLQPSHFNPSSADQCKRLLYDNMLVPRQYDKKGTITTDDEALDRIGKMEMAFRGVEQMMDPRPGVKRRQRMPGLRVLCELIKDYRNIRKQMQFMTSELSAAGRLHSSFNVAAAWTGRWSSSKDPFKRGGNLQNVAERHRYTIVPDPGYEMFYADKKTAESLMVAYLSGDESYIEAHAGDVHTWVCRKVWPELPWTGDIKQDKKIASSRNPDWDTAPGHNYRFQSKRIQHGSNFGLTPHGIAMIARIPVDAARVAQRAYFSAFPMIPAWQDWVRDRTWRQLPIVNALKREVALFGRPKDPHTHKQALAFAPQGGVGDILNLGLWRIWHELDPWLVQVLAQVHDAVLGQYKIEDRENAIAAIRRCMRVSVPVTDFRGTLRVCTILDEVAVGANWGHFNDDPEHGRLNLNGLQEIR